MDSILIVGKTDDKVLTFFKKVGYKISYDSDPKGIATTIQDEIIDLVLIDSTQDRLGHEFVEFFRKTDKTREVPILVLSPDKLQTLQIKDLHYDKIECLQAPYSLGTIVSRVATQLRLRKMSGQNEETASLSEVNASLRDLNERYAKELEEAKAIQKSLLPRDLPTGPSYEVGALYQPLEGVGGDWYHAGLTPSGKVLMLIADVTGHGLPAAFIGSMTKLALIAAKKEEPSELLHEMNALMAPVIPQGRFVTGNAFLYDPESSKLLVARAGGAAAIHLKRASGETVELLGDGFPIGFFEDSSYTQVEATLASGDLLLIVTDGITEGQNRKKEFFGFEGLCQCLKSTSNSDTAEAVLNKIYDDFKKFLDGRIIKDDVTLLLLKRK